ncbi:MAG: hypothetical protein U0M15_08585 [Bacillota bacterium]|nr:hypothetical protein [Bacillota bacterium]
MKELIVRFVKRETVLVIAGVLAMVSCFLIPPDTEYADYIDTRTLILLFCLMAVTAGLQDIGFFHYMGSRLLAHVRTRKSLAGILVFLCFLAVCLLPMMRL